MKRFYNNTLIGGACSKALRVVALLCVLLGISGNAWGAYYLHYNNTGSHTKDVGASDLKWTDGVEPVDNVCTWTISTSAWDNYVYIMSSKTNKTILDITGATISNKSSNIDFGNISDHNSKKLFYFKQKSAKQITITITYNLSTKVITLADGSAGTCTPSATITGASYDGTNINLSGRLSQVCDSKTTFYGWQYKTSASGDWEAYISGTGGKDNSSQITKDYSYAWNNGGNLVAGTTYYFRAYATYDAKTWYSDDKILSVTIPNGGGSTGEADCSGVVYLNPNTDWKSASAWFAVYYWKGSGGAGNDGWVKMNAAASCTGLYYAVIPEGYSNLCFVRMNPASDALNWDSKWNQTGNLTLQQDKNCYNNAGWDGSDNTKWTTTDCTDGCIPAEQPSTNVLLSREAIVNKSAKTAQLFGYLKSIKAPNCPTSEIADYGFFYCMVNDGDAPCTPTSSSTPIAADPSPALSRGMEFTATVGLIKEPSDALQDGKTYYYRAYAKIDDKYILSGEIRSFSTDPCIPQYGGLSDNYVKGTPIVYTINADPSFAKNECKLHFKSLQEAINHLKATDSKDDDFKYVTKSGDSYNLNQPVIMRVAYYDDAPDDETKAYIYEGTSEYGITAGNEDPDHINLIADFNKNSLTPENTLSIKPLGSKAKPWIHHIVIRNSKNIVLDSLCIYSDISGKGDNALEIDVNSKDWGRLDIDPTISSVAPMLDANITIQNSMIGSAGFTGVHVSCYGGITFKNNDFECTYPGTESNDIKWGASAKFLACKDMKFIQNNFRGSQATLLWVQECQNMLFMNNVFWNTNTNSNDTYQPIAAVRLVHQFNANTNDYYNKSDIKNISCFYNTFYLAEDKKDSNHNYNFFVLSNTTDSHSSSAAFDLNSIKFQYNNCYSYDAQVSGRSNNTGAFLGIDLSEHANFCPNNFWSEYDQKKGKTTSDFAFGCSGNTFTNVKTQVCETTASGPASLIIKAQAMNTGKKLTDSDISSTGIELTANELTSDRYLIGVRPKDDTWTMGAYQSKNNIETKVIYWVGVSSDWDDRNNWEYETEVDGKMVRQRVSCVNNLSEDLKVVVEEIGTLEIAGGRQWPQIPESFTENRTNSDYGEHVSAGLGVIPNPTKFASTIELEYGAGIKGVENLKDSEGNVLYDQAIVHFDADRSKWLLVGNVIKPKDAKTGAYRNSVSGDYYLNHVPQVYMHKAYFDEDADTVKWDKTFADLEIPVPSDEVYAINVTGYYGTSWYPVKSYNKRYGTNYSDTEPQPYVFTGRFAITEETEGGNNFVYRSWQNKNLFNNVYPCNLNASYIDEHIGSVSIYDYEKGSFKPLDQIGNRADVLIRSQNGFVIENNKGKSDFEITMDLLAGGSTRTRSTAVELPTFSLLVDNANTTAPGASNVIVRIDENQDVGYQSTFNTSKVFTQNENTPEAYLISNDAMYSRLYVGKDVKRIPLGIHLRKGMNITFKQVYNEGFDKVILLDTHTGKEYNLLHRSYTTEMLQGTVEGRFYLVFTIEEQDDNQDDDFTTDIEDSLTEQASINIYAVGSSTVRVLSNNTELQQIYVSDMAGRTMRYDASGNFAELQLPVSQGVYLVQVIADNATRTEKVILK